MGSELVNGTLRRLQPLMLDVLYLRYDDDDEVMRRWLHMEGLCEQWATEEGLVGGATNPMSSTMMLCYAMCAPHKTLGRTLTHEDFMHMDQGAMDDSLESLGFTNWNRLEGVRPLMGGIHLIIRGYQALCDRLRDGAWGHTWHLRTNPLHRVHGVAYAIGFCPMYDFTCGYGYFEAVRWMCARDQLMPPVFHAHLVRHKTPRRRRCMRVLIRGKPHTRGSSRRRVQVGEVGELANREKHDRGFSQSLRREESPMRSSYDRCTEARASTDLVR